MHTHRTEPEPGELVEDWYHLVDQRKEGLQLDQPVLPTHYARQNRRLILQERFVGRGGIRLIQSDEVAASRAFSSASPAGSTGTAPSPRRRTLPSSTAAARMRSTRRKVAPSPAWSSTTVSTITAAVPRLEPYRQHREEAEVAHWSFRDLRLFVGAAGCVGDHGRRREEEITGRHRKGVALRRAWGGTGIGMTPRRQSGSPA